MDAARSEQKDMAEFNRLSGLIESEIKDEMQYQNERSLKNPYDEDSNNLIDNPVWYKSLTQEEVDDMEILAHKLQEA